MLKCWRGEARATDHMMQVMAFFSLLVSTTAALNEIAFLLIVGIICDCFVSTKLIIPASIALLDGWLLPFQTLTRSDAWTPLLHLCSCVIVATVTFVVVRRYNFWPSKPGKATPGPPEGMLSQPCRAQIWHFPQDGSWSCAAVTQKSIFQPGIQCDQYVPFCVT